MEKPVAIIALGANLGNRETTLRRALSQLETAGIRVLAVSDFIETEPVGYTDQPNFLNGAAALEVPAGFSPESLLDRLLSTESALGRERPFPNAPRTCDLDLLFFEDERRATPHLSLPHPRWQERAFVLIPLADLFEKARASAQSWVTRSPWNSIRQKAAEFLQKTSNGQPRA